jgi:coenzyme PQQ synthesis protein D (PqqD)
MDGRIVYRRNENVVARKVGDDVVVVPIRHNVGDLDSVYTFNEVAARVWSLIDGRRVSGDVLEAVCGEFDVSRDVAEQDLGELFASLEEAGLIEKA